MNAVSLQHTARHWALGVALALYLALALPDLATPGLHYDEALEAATPAVLLLQGKPFPIINDGALQIGDLRLPLMVQNHIGALQIYASMPFVALLGPTTVALRTMTVIVGAATLIGTYIFMLGLYGRTAAGTAALWLAAFPSFVLWSRQGVFVTNLAPCLIVWAFAAAATSGEWRVKSGELLERRRSAFSVQRSAFLTGVLAGLAVWAKLSALWLVNGALVWLALVWLAKRWSVGALERRSAISCFAGFLLGVVPIILYNFITGFKTFAVVGASASETYLGTSNRDVLGNFGTRLVQFADVVASDQHLWYLGGTFPNMLALLSIIAALGIIATLLVLWHGRNWQRDLFLPFLALACIAQSCFTISALWHTHFAIVVWLPAAIVGGSVGAVERWSVGTLERWSEERRARRQRLVGVIGGLFFLLGVVVPQAGSTLAYLDAARTTGGLSFHSTAIEDVSRFLASRPEPIIALDWGLSAQIEYLTGGHKRVEELYGFTRDAPLDFAPMLRARFGGGELYLTHAAGEEAFPRREAFLDAVAAAGLHAEAVNVSTRRDGLPLIEVWRVGK